MILKEEAEIVVEFLESMVYDLHAEIDRCAYEAHLVSTTDTKRALKLAEMIYPFLE